MSAFTLRPAAAADLPRIVNLSRLAFAPLRTEVEVEQDWFDGSLDVPGHQFFLAVEATTGEVVGSYAQLALQLSLTSQLFPTMGIAAVAVAPHWRGQGIARYMMEHAVKMARDRQIALMMLYPFQHGFYRKLGWAWVGRSHQYRVSTRHLPLYPERTRMLPYDPGRDADGLRSSYDRACLQQNGWLHRPDWQWTGRLKPAKGKEIYCYREAADIEGYLILQLTQLQNPRSTLAVVVQEWVALTARAYRGLLGFLAGWRDQAPTVIWNTYPDDPFPSLLQEQQRDPSLITPPFEFGLTHAFGEIGGGFMWRLADIPAAFQRRPVQPTPPFQIGFQITDPVPDPTLPTPYTLTVEFINGQMQSLNQPATTVLHLSTSHLTQLFSGFRRATELLWTGEIELEGDVTLLSYLDAAWHTRAPFCWDFF